MPNSLGRSIGGGIILNELLITSSFVETSNHAWERLLRALVRARMVPVPSRAGEEETEGLVSRHVVSSLCFVGRSALV
jgi:hypothetical protein